MALASILLVGAAISFGLAAFSVNTGRVNTVGLGLLLGTLSLLLPVLN